MAQFQNVITTLKGRTLIAKMIAGAGNIRFKNIQTSSDIFTPLQLPSLDELTTINQTTLISRVTRTNDAAIRIEGAVNNITLKQSYNCNTVGITATDPDEGDILFGVTIVDLSVPDNTPDFIPAFNGITSTGILFDLILTVDNSESVSLQVDPAAVATSRQLSEVIKVVEKLQAEINTLDNSGGVIFSPTRPSGNWTLWLQDLGEIDELFENDDTLELITAPIDAPGDFAVEDETGAEETVVNMTDDPQAAVQGDIILAE